MTSELVQFGDLLLLGFVWTGIIGAVVVGRKIVMRVVRAVLRQRRERRIPMHTRYGGDT